MIAAKDGVAALMCGGKDSRFGPGLRTLGEITLCGAAQAEHEARLEKSVVLEGGVWQDVFCGYVDGESPFADQISVTVDGAQINGQVHLLGGCKFTNADASVSLTVKCGRLRAGIFATDLSGDAALECRAAANVALEGGDIGGNIRPMIAEKEKCGVDWNIKISGGRFASVSELSGSCAAKSQLSFAGGFDSHAEESGTIEFQNPIRHDTDPWVTFWEGFYYYTVTMKGALKVWRVANLADIPYTVPSTVYVPGPETDFNGLWSPELHYFSADDFGPEFEGWYLYLAGNRNNAEGNSLPVMFVMKSLNGKPDGQYGHPLTGEANRFISIDSCADVDYTKIWACGQTIARIDGKIYTMFVTESGRQTPDFKQHINIALMSNPFTFGQPHIIINPTYDFEKHGHEYSQERQRWLPQVVEGGTAIYDDAGKVYIAYTGSGFWSTYYCLAQIRHLGGDPLDIENYRKDDKPFLVREETLTEDSISGCGHASYIRDFDGGRWAFYHGYIGVDTRGKRLSFLEPYGIDGQGNIYVGDGSGHPAPLDRAYRLRVNPMPLCYKIVGFENYQCAEKYEEPFCCSDEVRLARKKKS